ncbi:MAG TPA: hypothetical protein ENJ00_00325 [Phycisphaerales bacterium]|nr:hypothetical protein [Phycisphaerales bacterium]
MADPSRMIEGPKLPEVLMHLHRPNEPGIGVVTKTEWCTTRKPASFVRHIEIDVSRTKLAGHFRAGQSFGVLPPGLNEKGRPHSLRLYSISSPTCGEDGKGQVLSTTVKRVIDEHWDSHKLFLGVASNYLCDLAVGDEVRVTGPNGKRFLLPENHSEYNYVFFATGTGIAPFRGMIADLYSNSRPASVTLVMGVAYATDLLYDDHFRALADSNPEFSYLTAISRERQEDTDRHLYAQGRLETHRDYFVDLLGKDNTLVYVCGLASMEIGIFKQLTKILPPEIREQYLRVDPEVVGSVDSWTKDMINRKLHPTRRMFLEVY